ncbi:SCO2525 family SAM-dependent methyltransferase [Catellatospora citrea]|uniref:SCO2525 family SAM-dependent methyltransferase n=1 Tax=Catellatospora citrea TaxID=53366 RepID=UPI0033ED5F2F
MKVSSVVGGSSGLGVYSNGCYDWDKFNADSYLEANYVELRDDDREMLRRVAKFFSRLGKGLGVGARGLDVGPGSNLYPALSMLPFCGTLDFWEWSQSNVAWLRRQTLDLDLDLKWPWYAYWNILLGESEYRQIADPRTTLARLANVRKGNIFALPKRHWDLGTMFFVAESITCDRNEFDLAISSFLRALKPGAPFAAAFMTESQGYTVDGIRFPAFAVSRQRIESLLLLHGANSGLSVDPIPTASPVRQGYKEMVLAIGTVDWDV